jgi:predicted lactoylglutathione lyase
VKRLHVNLGVDDLAASVRFYSRLFDAQPTLLKEDYARWMLEDPRVNFAISRRSGRKSVDHLGIQAESEAELNDMFARLEAAEGAVLDEGETTCCYARSRKRWITDPQGVTWETFLTHGEAASFGQERPDTAGQPVSGAPCCG